MFLLWPAQYSFGAPTFVSGSGTAIRTSVEFPILPGRKFLLSTDKKSGYTVAIHPDLPLTYSWTNPMYPWGFFPTPPKGDSEQGSS